DGRLLARSHGVGGEETGATVAAQIGNDGAKAGSVDDRDDLIERARIVGETVQEHDGKCVGRTGVLIGDVQDRSANAGELNHYMSTHESDAPLLAHLHLQCLEVDPLAEEGGVVRTQLE